MPKRGGGRSRPYRGHSSLVQCGCNRAGLDHAEAQQLRRPALPTDDPRTWAPISPVPKRHTVYEGTTPRAALTTHSQLDCLQDIREDSFLLGEWRQTGASAFISPCLFEKGNQLFHARKCSPLVQRATQSHQTQYTLAAQRHLC